jgi:Terminase large subunit, T4likevirus-type, N-terminal
MRVCSCGRRFGKSIIGGHELVVQAFMSKFVAAAMKEQGRRREFWIVGPEYSDSEKEFRVLWNKLQSVGMPFDKPGSYNNPESGPMVISLFGGTTVFHAKSAKYPSTLVGEGLAGVVMAEAAKMKSIVWTKYVRPTLADSRGWGLFLSTPEGKNWFYDLYMRGLDPADLNWAGFRMPSYANPIIFPFGADDPEILDMRKDMSEEKAKQEIDASFTEYVGRVFKRFEEEVHVTDLHYIPGRPLWGAVDYGWTNPFVWLDIQVDHDGNVNVLREYYQTEQDTNEHGAYLLRTGRTNERYRGFFPDPAEPDDTYTLSNLLRIPARSNTGGPLSVRLELIRNALKAPKAGMTAEGMRYARPRLQIDRSCVNLIREMNDYRYPESKEEAARNPRDEPIDKDNHGPEALGRFMRGYFGTPARNTGSRSRQARITRTRRVNESRLPIDELMARKMRGEL